MPKTIISHKYTFIYILIDNFDYKPLIELFYNNRMIGCKNVINLSFEQIKQYNYLTFTFIRNPRDALFYYYKNKTFIEKSNKLQITNNDISFTEFMKELSFHKKRIIQFNYISENDKLKIDHIIQFKYMRQYIKQLFKRCGILLKKININTQYYHNNLPNHIRKILKKDFLLFDFINEKDINIPNIIWMYWDKGYDNCPDIIKICYESWKKYNTNYKIIFLDDTNLIQYINIKNYIPDIDKKNIKIQHFADIIRLILLHKYGGYWVDGTLLCTKSLNSWIQNRNKSSFFAFRNPTNWKLLSNWFLCSCPNGYIITTWLNSVINYWNSNDKLSNYFYHHKLFKILYKKNNKFKFYWDNSSIYCSHKPHYLLKLNLLNQPDEEIKIDIDQKITPLFKLNKNYNYNSHDNNAINYIINN